MHLAVLNTVVDPATLTRDVLNDNNYTACVYVCGCVHVHPHTDADADNTTHTIIDIETCAETHTNIQQPTMSAYNLDFTHAKSTRRVEGGWGKAGTHRWAKRRQCNRQTGCSESQRAQASERVGERAKSEDKAT